MLKQFLRQVDGYIQTVHPYKIKNTKLLLFFEKKEKYLLLLLKMCVVTNRVSFFCEKSFKRFFKYFVKVGKTLRIVTFHKFILITKLSLCEC